MLKNHQQCTIALFLVFLANSAHAIDVVHSNLLTIESEPTEYLGQEYDVLSITCKNDADISFEWKEERMRKKFIYCGNRPSGVVFCPSSAVASYENRGTKKLALWCPPTMY
jgi:hypothetical protein